MFFRQIFLPGLAHYSYVLASSGKGVVIDPKRDVQEYIDIAQENDFEITHILETHLHADFISGHIELAAKTGAKIIVPESAHVSFDHIPVREGSEFSVGKLHFCVVETPGHTPESISYVVRDDEVAKDVPWMIFSGDALFVGDVGRPDLFGYEKAKELIAKMFETLRKFEKLEDSVLVYPCHGAGSLCGKAISKAPYSTIGMEKKNNYVFKAKTVEELEKIILEGMPEAPEHFKRSSKINGQGPKLLGGIPEIKALSPEAFKARLEKGDCVLLDVRDSISFCGAHVPNSYNIGISPVLSVWAGWVLPFDKPILIVNNGHKNVRDAVVQLIRVGFDDYAGYLKGGVNAWAQKGFTIDSIRQISVDTLVDMLSRKETILLDVRTAKEREKSYIEGSIHIPLGDLKTRLSELDKDKSISVICGSGYRASLACSILKMNGFKKVNNIVGGFSAWQSAGYPVV